MFGTNTMSAVMSLSEQHTVPRVTRAQTGMIVLSHLLVAALAVVACLPPISQNVGYHAFHDERTWLGVPNALNVLSNIPFVVIGLLGLRHVHGASEASIPGALRTTYLILFGGLLLTGFGSAYYHWAPDNHTLVWDRLPMTLAFTSLFAAILGERIDLTLGRRAALPLVAIGIGSVLWWAAFDDLRFYAFVQFFPILAIPVMLWAFPARYTASSGIVAALGCYLVAKGLEKADGAIFAAGHLVSGHTLKHLVAAAGGWCLYRMLVVRRPIGARA
jgi:Ceramidase